MRGIAAGPVLGWADRRLGARPVAVVGAEKCQPCPPAARVTITPGTHPCLAPAPKARPVDRPDHPPARGRHRASPPTASPQGSRIRGDGVVSRPVGTGKKTPSRQHERTTDGRFDADQMTRRDK